MLLLRLCFAWIYLFVRRSGLTFIRRRRIGPHRFRIRQSTLIASHIRKTFQRYRTLIQSEAGASHSKDCLRNQKTETSKTECTKFQYSDWDSAANAIYAKIDLRSAQDQRSRIPQFLATSPKCCSATRHKAVSPSKQAPITKINTANHFFQ